MPLAISHPIEAQIAILLQAGDWTGASTVALRGYGPPVLSYLRRRLRDDDLASDVFSRFCEKVWRSVADFRGESSFATWAYRLAWFAVREHRRAERRRREERLADDALAEVAGEGAPAGLAAEARDRWATLVDALEPFDRSLLRLRVERELSWKEVARILSAAGETVEEPALRKRFERLRLRLYRLAGERRGA